LGTATTFDVVSAKGAYIGGVIAPGILTSSENLFQKAAKLHRIRLKPPERTIGKNTVMALRSGILHGSAGGIDRIVENIKQEMQSEAKVIATGGLAEMIAPLSKAIQMVDPLLTIKGLQIISQLQE